MEIDYVPRRGKLPQNPIGEEIVLSMERSQVPRYLEQLGQLCSITRIVETNSIRSNSSFIQTNRINLSHGARAIDSNIVTKNCLYIYKQIDLTPILCFKQ